MSFLSIRFRICILVMLCLLLVGCSSSQGALDTMPSTEPPTEPPTDPPSSPAMDALLAIYGGKDLSSPLDYTLVNFFQIDGIKYAITWSADVDESIVAIIPNSDGTVTVDVNETCEVDTPYTLTAKVATADGQWVTHSWDCVLPQYMEPAKILADAEALEHGQRLSYPATLVGKISAINKDYDAVYENITLTIRIIDVEYQPIRCYSLQGEGIETLEEGDVIAVTGFLQNYGRVLEFDSGCTLDAIVKS